MMSDGKEFRLALNRVYRQDPCKILPNALWKTEARLTTHGCSVSRVHGEVEDLKAWDQRGLYVFWNKSRTIDKSFQAIRDISPIMVIHDDHFRQIDVSGYSLIKAFFRIHHDHRNISSYNVPSDFYIREANPEQEYPEISDFITRCYRDLHPSPDTVRRWTTHKVYDRNLWIWIVDGQKGVPAALGIAEFDSSVPEGSLEWIQVLPDYQGRGLGKILVLELLKRLEGRAEFTTVSGEVDNETNPERLYRRCGFVGNDVWWLLRRRMADCRRRIIT